MKIKEKRPFPLFCNGGGEDEGKTAKAEEPGNTEEQQNALKEILNGAQNAVIGEGQNRVSVTVEQERQGEGYLAGVYRADRQMKIFRADSREGAVAEISDYLKGEQTESTGQKNTPSVEIEAKNDTIAENTEVNNKKKGETNHGESEGYGTRAGGERTVGVGADGNAGAMEEGAGQNKSRFGSGRGAGVQGESRRRLAENIGVARSSAAEYGIVNGSNRRTAIFFKYGESKDANRLINGDEELNLIQTRARERGQEVIFFAGLVELELEDGSNMVADGIQQGNRIFVQVDSNSHSASGIYNHEDTHIVLEANGGQRGKLFKSLAAELKRQLGEKYAETYERYKKDLPANYTELDVIEEMICDARGKMNGFTDTQELSNAVQNFVEENRKGGKQNGETGQSKASFAGKRSKTADEALLQRAEQMEWEGADSETIRQETGWFRGADGQWRYEIDDSGAEFRRDGDARLMEQPGYRRMQELTDKWEKSFDGGQELSEEEEKELETLQGEYEDEVWREKYLLRDFLKHEELFRAYPYMNRVSLVFDDLPDGTKGYFSKRSNAVVLSNTLFGKEMETLLHEIQHVIQKVEGFAEGANPEYWRRRMEDGYSKRTDKGLEMMPSDLYRNTAGEIEARDAANRRGLSAEERKNTPPDTGDVNTVFADDSGVSLYTAYDESGKPVTVVTTGQDVFAGAGKSKYANIAQKIIKDKFRGETLPLGENDLARITGKSAGEYGYPAKREEMTAGGYSAKMKAATELDNLLENSEYVRWARDNPNHRHKEAELGWDYYKTVFVVDGKAFEGIINIANSENGRMFYDMTDVKEIPGTYGEYVARLARSSPVSGNLYGNKIARPEGDVKGSMWNVDPDMSSIGVDRENPIYRAGVEEARMAQTVVATVVDGGVRLGNGEIVPPPAGMSAEEFAGKLNALAERRQEQRTAPDERKKATAPEEQKEVTLTEALEKIGVKNITGSLADYGNMRSEQNVARFYLHEVLAADGNIIMEMKEAPVSVKTGFSQETDITGNDTEASGENVPKDGGAVNTAEELLEGNTEEQQNALKEILNGARNAVIGEGRNRVSVTVEQEKRGEG